LKRSFQGWDLVNVEVRHKHLLCFIFNLIFIFYLTFSDQELAIIILALLLARSIRLLNLLIQVLPLHLLGLVLLPLELSQLLLILLLLLHLLDPQVARLNLSYRGFGHGQQHGPSSRGSLQLGLVDQDLLLELQLSHFTLDFHADVVRVQVHIDQGSVHKAGD